MVHLKEIRTFTIQPMLMLLLVLTLIPDSIICCRSFIGKSAKMPTTTMEPDPEARDVFEGDENFVRKTLDFNPYIPTGITYNKTQDDFVAPAVERHTSTIIFFHDLGDSGESWGRALKYIRPPHMKVISPSAEAIPFTLKYGVAMFSSWFNKGHYTSTSEDPGEVRAACKYVHKLIEKEIQSGIKPERIIVGGFSQGAALALKAALTFPKRLGGIIAYNAWIPVYQIFFQRVNNVNKDIPILQGHGETDNLVPVSVGNWTATSLIHSVTTKLAYKIYPNVGHTISKRGMEDIMNFIARRVNYTLT